MARANNLIKGTLTTNRIRKGAANEEENIQQVVISYIIIISMKAI